MHFLRNALDYLPRKADDDCLQELRWLYDRRNGAEAQRDLPGWLGRSQKKYPKLTDWVEENIGQTLTFYRLPRTDTTSPQSTVPIRRYRSIGSRDTVARGRSFVSGFLLIRTGSRGT